MVDSRALSLAFALCARTIRTRYSEHAFIHGGSCDQPWPVAAVAIINEYLLCKLVRIHVTRLFLFRRLCVLRVLAEEKGTICPHHLSKNARDKMTMFNGTGTSIVWSKQYHV